MKRYRVVFYDYRTSEIPLWEYCVDVETPAGAVAHALSMRPRNVAGFHWIEVAALARRERITEPRRGPLRA